MRYTDTVTPEHKMALATQIMGMGPKFIAECFAAMGNPIWVIEDIAQMFHPHWRDEQLRGWIEAQCDRYPEAYSERQIDDMNDDAYRNSRTLKTTVAHWLDHGLWQQGDGFMETIYGGVQSVLMAQRGNINCFVVSLDDFPFWHDSDGEVGFALEEVFAFDPEPQAPSFGYNADHEERAFIAACKFLLAACQSGPERNIQN